MREVCVCVVDEEGARCRGGTGVDSVGRCGVLGRVEKGIALGEYCEVLGRREAVEEVCTV